MSIATELVAAFEPVMTTDLQTYLETIASMFSEVELLAFSEEDDELGWAILLDPDQAPANALPYLAQYMGERLPEGISEPMAREWIKDAPNMRRGTVQSIIRAAQRTLVGQRTVSVLERVDPGGGLDPGDYLTVVTYAEETPNSAAVLADLRTVVPADVVLTYEVRVGQAWANVSSAKASWTAVQTTWATWEDVRNVRTGWTTYTRPRPI